MDLLELSLPPRLVNFVLEEGAARPASESSGVHLRLLARCKEWPLGWIDLPGQNSYAEQCQRLAEQTAQRFDTLIVCGIGGSALGTQAVLSAIQLPGGEQRRVIVLDNADPTQVAELARSIDLRRAAVNVISKSGETLETMAGFLYLLGALKAQGGARDGQIIATTGQRGLLREMAQSEGWQTLPVPDDVGGRFSVFTPVGLFPLEFAGIDVDALLDGAAHASQEDAFQLAALHYLLHTRGNAQIAVQYVYGDPLVRLGDWWRQLWAESLAKAVRLDGSPSGIGQTPLVARGSTDQHSQNQLFMEGPDNKLYGFVTARKWQEDPQVVSGIELPESLRYLEGRAFGQVLEACRIGTRDALIAAGRPMYELTLAALDERSVGAYLQTWMLATAYAGLLYGVNAFDQPGVERSKVITKRILEEGWS